MTYSFSFYKQKLKTGQVGVLANKCSVWWDEMDEIAEKEARTCELREQNAIVQGF
jgi:hypothetical protein